MRSAIVWLVSLALIPVFAVSSAADEADLVTLLEGLASSRGVAAEFRESRELALLVAPLESSGRLYFVPPDRMARFTVEPAPSAFLVEGERVRFREGADTPEQEVDLSTSPLARAFVENLMVVFRGDRAELERRYRPTLETDPEGWALTLVPRGATLSRHLAAIVLRGDDAGLREMEVRDADGDRTRTTFTRVDMDRAFSPAEPERIFAEGAPLDATP